MPATDALFIKHELQEDCESNGLMASALSGFLESFHRVTDELSLGTPRKPDGKKFASVLAVWLKASECFYVDQKMHPLLTAAAESMPEEPLLPPDLPSDQGFLWIPGGLATIDIRGQLLMFNAFSWSAFGGKVTVVAWTDKYDPRDRLLSMVGRETWEITPRITVSHISRLEFGKPLPNSFRPGTIIPPEVPIHVRARDGEAVVEFEEGFEDLRRDLEFEEETDPALQWLVTCWRLMQQSITTIEEVEPTRQQRRQLQRKNRPEQKVSVVMLRRTGSHEHEHRDVAWTHRWLRRGHWRRQWYGSGENRYQRAIFIHPTICGPDDLPLLVREHVYDLGR